MAQVRHEESDRLELLEVRLGSGKVYLVNALPVSAPQLIVSASTTGGPLDPSGLPSEAGVVARPSFPPQQRENAK